MTKVFISPGCGTSNTPIELWVNEGFRIWYEAMPSTTPVEDARAISAWLRNIQCVEISIEENMASWRNLALDLRRLLPSHVPITRFTFRRPLDEELDLSVEMETMSIDESESSK